MCVRVRATLRRVDVMEIGSAPDHLRLSTEPDDPALHYLVADLSAGGLAATKRVYAHDASGWREPADSFAGLAALIVVVVFAFGGVIEDIFQKTCNSVGQSSSGSC